MPVMLGDARLATEFADEMLSESVVFFELIFLLSLFLEKGIYVIGFSFPVVPVGNCDWKF